ncbi:hypothetical protein ALC53_04413 [Atta colombica]|uniref:Uncharacterized protein n=1 Tax=Atta colombica TaxID=520822 RepID=A0A195BKH6_9HYME|nr:hypothetical protein ALC53_04413 [Atta colombica]
MFTKMIEESDEEDEEDENFKLYLTNDELFEDLLPNNHPSEEDTNSTSLTQKETEESHELRTMEKATTRNTLRDKNVDSKPNDKKGMPSRISNPEISHNKRMKLKE